MELTNAEANNIFIRRTERSIRRALQKRGWRLKSRKHFVDGPYQIISEAGLIVYDRLDLNEARRIACDVLADWKRTSAN